jgi:hypothetical protein
MEVSAWITQDKTATLQPRSPLENGRTRCENASPSETATCSAGYGEVGDGDYDNHQNLDAPC